MLPINSFENFSILARIHRTEGPCTVLLSYYLAGLFPLVLPRPLPSLTSSSKTAERFFWDTSITNNHPAPSLAPLLLSHLIVSLPFDLSSRVAFASLWPCLPLSFSSFLITTDSLTPTNTHPTTRPCKATVRSDGRPCGPAVWRWNGLGSPAPPSNHDVFQIVS